jgi:acyl-CoA dehydrogenase
MQYYGLKANQPFMLFATDMRHLRFADGPDEVHHMVVGRNELRRHNFW